MLEGAPPRSDERTDCRAAVVAATAAAAHLPHPRFPSRPGPSQQLASAQTHPAAPLTAAAAAGSCDRRFDRLCRSCPLLPQRPAHRQLSPSPIRCWRAPRRGATSVPIAALLSSLLLQLPLTCRTPDSRVARGRRNSLLPPKLTQPPPYPPARQLQSRSLTQRTEVKIVEGNVTGTFSSRWRPS